MLELDDLSHQSARAQKADEFKNRALAAAGVPLLRVKVAGANQVSQLRKRIMELAEIGMPTLQQRSQLSKPGPFEMAGRD